MQQPFARSRGLSFLLLLILAPASWADAPGVYAITGGTVYPVAGSPIPGGAVVIRDGLIESVGPAIAVPPDAMVIDATGHHVYPGLIDAHTSYGVPTPKERERGGEPGPDTVVLRMLAPTGDETDGRRATGVTTVVTAPANGIFNGQSVMLNLGEGALESRVIRNPAAMQVSFNTRPNWTWPDSLMGVVAFLRQTFLDARHHIAATDIYTRSPAGLQRPPASPMLDALAPVVRRELPVVFVADSDLMMKRAAALAREHELRFAIAGARQAYEEPSLWKDVPLLVSVKWTAAPSNAEDRAEQPLRVIRERQLAPTTPAELAKRGHLFALVSGPGKAGDFLPGIRKAIDNGLSAEDALRATTIAPARIFGVERQLGTLERGKIANVVVADKPIFEEGAKIRRIFVDGVEIRLPRENAKPAASAASPIDGSWAISVNAPQGGIAFQVVLTAEGSSLSGTWSGDRGSGDISGGTFADGRFEFTISAAAQSDAENTDWVFAGTIDGDAMSGTVTTTLGSFEFSGSRAKGGTR